MQAETLALSAQEDLFSYCKCPLPLADHSLFCQGACPSYNPRPVFKNLSEDDVSTQSETISDYAQSPLQVLPLPPKTANSPKLTLVLDLDETLVHCTPCPIPDPDLTVTYLYNSKEVKGYVKYRPGLIDFLEFASDFFELVVFTAADQAYADQVLDSFDADRSLIQHRYYRDSCTLVNCSFVKDLTILGRDLRNVVIIDNSPVAYSLQKANGIPILTWTSDETDNELFAVYQILKKIEGAFDVRPYLKKLLS